MKHLYRPGHADYSFDAKYGFRDYRGGGRSSRPGDHRSRRRRRRRQENPRRSLRRKIVGYVTQVGSIKANVPDPTAVTLDQVEKLPNGEPNIVRCPDAAVAAQMVALIEDLRKQGDSIGGMAEIVATNIPAGLGEPVFDKLKADLAKALFSLPAVLGVEYGIGFGCVTMRGSEHNDHFVKAPAAVASPPTSVVAGLPTEPPSPTAGLPAVHSITTDTNRHGGMLGGISTGLPIILRAAVKPTSSLPIEQPTVTQSGEPATIRTKGRHDPCLLPRFVPMAEAMVAIVLADHWLRWRGQRP
ncbi:MAG: chorismate synthase [Planctomycetaceae bacterium]